MIIQKCKCGWVNVFSMFGTVVMHLKQEPYSTGEWQIVMHIAQPCKKYICAYLNVPFDVWVWGMAYMVHNVYYILLPTRA